MLGNSFTGQVNNRAQLEQFQASPAFEDVFGGKGLLGWLGNLFGKKSKTPQVAAPTPEPAPAVVAPKPWESGVNSTYGNAFGASPTQTTFGTLLSRQPTI